MRNQVSVCFGPPCNNYLLSVLVEYFNTR